MNNVRWLVSAAVLVAAIYAIGQGTSTSTSNSQSRNGGASSSASSSASARGGASVGGGQSGSGFAGGLPSRSGGTLNRPTHVVTYRFNSEAAPGMIVRQIDPALIEQQNQFWTRLSNSGKLVMAGYWRERDGGMAVLSLRDDREAVQIVQSDPTVKAGAAYAIRAYTPTVLSLTAPAAGAGTTQNSTNTSSSSQRSASGR